MNIEREICDLFILRNQDGNVINEFCQLAIQTLKEEGSSKVTSSISHKLTSNPIQIAKGFEAILSIFLKANKKGWKEEDLTLKLKEISWLNDDSRKEIMSVYLDNRQLLSLCQKEISIKGLQYENLDWRFDILSKTKMEDKISEPVVTLNFQLKDEVSNSREELELRADPSTLMKMTETLEAALQESRSHHVRSLLMGKRSSKE